jgi:hypothetical protein
MPFDVQQVSCQVGPTWEWILEQPQWVRDHPRLLEAVADLEGSRLDRRGVLGAQLQGILRDMDRQDGASGR